MKKRWLAAPVLHTPGPLPHLLLHALCQIRLFGLVVGQLLERVVRLPKRLHRHVSRDIDVMLYPRRVHHAQVLALQCNRERGDERPDACAL